MIERSEAYRAARLTSRTAHLKTFTKDNVDDWVAKEPMSGCWLWLGAMTPMGYGATGKSTAHRAVYQMLKHEVPNGLDVMHVCHNRACVNPSHMDIGTRLENVRMSMDAGRLDKKPELLSIRIKAYLQTRKRNGHIVGHRSQFTDAQIQSLRSRFLSGEPSKTIATDFGVTPQAINAIAKRKTYRYVP